MLLPFKLNLGSPIGNGKQYMPWIHIEDLARIYIFSLKTNIEGIYNAVAPEHINNRKFSQELAKALGRKFFMPNVPKFALFHMYGEMAKILTEGSKVSCEKIISENYHFKYKNVRNTLASILTKY
jgi:NAD dependent epimerase/dehydratase family enzyme